MDNYRSLTVDEIETLEQCGCTADDWTRVSVSGDFVPTHIVNVAFHGDVSLGVFDKTIDTGGGFMRHTGIRNATLHDVTIGDNCLVENVAGYISRYVIGEESVITGIGTMVTTEGATYGQGNTVAVLNEAGDGNVVLYDGLTAQMAAFMVECASDKDTWQRLRLMAEHYAEAQRPEQGQVGYRVKIANTREITNTIINDECEINGASRLSECTIISIPEAGTFIGSDTICDNTIIQAGSSVLDGARLYNCFVGEACHIGKGFSAENSLFFANSHMDNGEACAAFCGPFSVSHHKSTLLIGGQYSFYNAGSATNFSNHAYKLGPIHHGTLERGAKTASGAHLLWPATIGAFSVCLGKIQNHPDTSDLPFSYIIGTEGATYLVPGRNLTTVGTFRDIAKWPKRDMRPRSSRQTIVNFDWLSPYVMAKILRAKHILETLKAEQGNNVASYNYNGCVIKNSGMQKGLRLYDMAIRMFFGLAVEGHYGELPENSIGTGQWTDLSGLLVPATEVEQLAEDIKNDSVSDIVAIEQRFASMHKDYETYKWNWTYRHAIDHLDSDMLTADDIERMKAEGEAARREWLNAVRYDAEREFALGDMDEDTLKEFIGRLQ